MKDSATHANVSRNHTATVQLQTFIVVLFRLKLSLQDKEENTAVTAVHECTNRRCRRQAAGAVVSCNLRPQLRPQEKQKTNKRM
jgi:hypothetical protein